MLIEENNKQTHSSDPQTKPRKQLRRPKRAPLRPTNLKQRKTEKKGEYADFGFLANVGMATNVGIYTQTKAGTWQGVQRKNLVLIDEAREKIKKISQEN